MSATEDGYEDMYDHLDTNSDLLKQIQSLMTQWMNEQGDSLNIYEEDYSKAVIIEELVKEIREQIRTENK